MRPQSATDLAGPPVAGGFLMPGLPRFAQLGIGLACRGGHPSRMQNVRGEELQPAPLRAQNIQHVTHCVKSARRSTKRPSRSMVVPRFSRRKLRLSRRSRDLVPGLFKPGDFSLTPRATLNIN